MNPDTLRELLAQVQSGSLPVDEAMDRLKHLPYEDLGFANIDHHRVLRQGAPEVVFCQNKETRDTIEIVKRLRNNQSPVLATRVPDPSIDPLRKEFPEAIYYERSRALVIEGEKQEEKVGNVLVIGAGTSDLPVMEEAAITARFTGSNAEMLADVGVAGIHRLLGRLDMIRNANVIVVVAGMEGALASVVGGLVDAPVIAVPTSVGYGASFGGLSALLTMLNSCSAGVTVVNIDNGFGAGYTASLINKRICQAS